jgi:hypothetical protein
MITVAQALEKSGEAILQAGDGYQSGSRKRVTHSGNHPVKA